MFEMTLLYLMLYILFLIEWHLSKKDVLSPSVLFIASFIMGTTFYLLGNKKNEAEFIALNTVLLIIICVIVFMIIERFIYLLVRSNKRYRFGTGYIVYQNYNEPSRKISGFYVVGIMILMFITAFVQFRFEKGYVGSGSFTAIVSQYRSESLTAGAPRSMFVNVFARIIYGLTPIYLFVIFFKRFVCGKKFKHPIFLSVLGILYVIFIFIISGSRGRAFIFLFQLLTTVVICMNLGGKKINPYKNKGNKFWFRAVLGATIIGIPLFYYGGVIGGKKYSTISPFQSVCNYFSYGLIRLNILINEGFTKSEHFGQWSFSGIYSMLNKMGMRFEDYDFFPFYGMFGNTSTIFGRWYVDFGIIGVLIMTCIVSTFYSIIFYKMKYSCSRIETYTLAMIYVFYISNILMASYDDWVRNILALNTVFQVIVLYVFSRYIYKKYIKENNYV